MAHSTKNHLFPEAYSGVFPNLSSGASPETLPIAFPGNIEDLGFHRLMKDLFAEESEGKSTLNLCAYDNILSENARSVLGFELGVRYRLGSLTHAPGSGAPGWDQKGSLTFKAMPGLERLEKAAQIAGLKLFGGIGIDLRPLSGVHATMATLLSVCPPGGTVASISPQDGGHFATRDVVERSGRKSVYLPWCRETQQPDLQGLAVLHASSPLHVLLLDPGCPSLPLPVREMRAILGADPFIAYDASHTLGLMAGGRFQDPIAEGADVLQGNTHKSFPGPQKALMVFGTQRAQTQIQAGLDGGLVSSQHTHDLMALSITLLEMEAFGKRYADTLIENARALKTSLLQRGAKLLGPSKTETHILLLEFESEGESQKAFRSFLQAGIATNARVIFNRPLIRVGVQEITRRGFIPEEMKQIAEWMARAPHEPETVRREISHALSKKTRVAYSFDWKNL